MEKSHNADDLTDVDIIILLASGCQAMTTSGASWGCSGAFQAELSAQHGAAAASAQGKANGFEQFLVVAMSALTPCFGAAAAGKTNSSACGPNAGAGSGLTDLAAMRKRLGLGPNTGQKGVPTVTRLDIGGETFYGISAHGQKITLRVNPVSRTYAEADVFQQAANSGVKARTATLYVDYPTGLCGYCGQSGAVRGMARQLGLDRVTVVYSGGSYTMAVD